MAGNDVEKWLQHLERRGNWPPRRSIVLGICAELRRLQTEVIRLECELENEKHPLSQGYMQIDSEGGRR